VLYPDGGERLQRLRFTGDAQMNALVYRWAGLVVLVWSFFPAAALAQEPPVASSQEQPAALSLQQQLQELQSRVKELEKLVTSLQRKVDYLENQVGVLSRKIEQLSGGPTTPNGSNQLTGKLVIHNHTGTEFLLDVTVQVGNVQTQLRSINGMELEGPKTWMIGPPNYRQDIDILPR